MNIITEKWEKGKLISRIEKDDGLPDIYDIDIRLKNIENRPASTVQTVPPIPERMNLIERIKRLF